MSVAGAADTEEYNAHLHPPPRRGEGFGEPLMLLLFALNGLPPSGVWPVAHFDDRYHALRAAGAVPGAERWEQGASMKFGGVGGARQREESCYSDRAYPI